MPNKDIFKEIYDGLKQINRLNRSSANARLMHNLSLQSKTLIKEPLKRFLTPSKKP